MKYYRLDEDTSEFAKDIIKDVLPLKYLVRICRELTISCEIAFVDETGNQHTATKYGTCHTAIIKLILMCEHFMPNVIVDKSVVVNCCKIN
jgi:hypothetical protein